jgi:molybdate transport system substrate-binding protein
VIGRRLLLAVCIWLAGTAVPADDIRIAVAANFTTTLREIASAFTESTGYAVTIVAGSTGKHYAQIHNGAPFDVFLAADSDHPRRLESEGLALSGSRFTYARGLLVLWSPDEGLIDESAAVLTADTFRHLAIANPDLAPYGAAAREVLTALGHWRQLEDRLVRGESIGQTFQFVASGAAELGFIARSQVTEPGGGMRRGSFWQVPQQLYTPIEQQVALLSDLPAARALVDFLAGDQARAIIKRRGYQLTDDGNP